MATGKEASLFFNWLFDTISKKKSNLLSTFLAGKPLQTVHASSKPAAGVKGTMSERTFIAIKPDGVQRGLVGKVISRFEDRGYKLVAIKSIVPQKDLIEKHYADLKARPFFPG